MKRIEVTNVETGQKLTGQLMGETTNPITINMRIDGTRPRSAVLNLNPEEWFIRELVKLPQGLGAVISFEDRRAVRTAPNGWTYKNYVYTNDEIIELAGRREVEILSEGVER